MKAFGETDIAVIVDEAEEKEEFPTEIFRKMGKLGYLGLSGPEEYGGGGAGKIEECLCVEEIARVSVSVAAAWVVQGALAPSLLWELGSEYQKRKYLIPTLRGEKIVSFAITENEAGSDVKASESMAIRDGDYYVLNASKTFVTLGAISDYVIVLAYTDRSRGIDGMSLFIVDRLASSYGIKRQRKEANKAAESADLYFKDCRLPMDNLIGNEGDGFRRITEKLSVERLMVSARAVGLAQAACDSAFRYSKERTQFRRRIGEFQSIAFKLADMFTAMNAGRLLAYYAAWLLDRRIECSKEVWAAKLLATETAAKATEDALHIHGGRGLLKDKLPVWRYFRDARVALVTAGSSEIQRRIIAAEMGFRV